MVMEWACAGVCADCKTDLLCVAFRRGGLKNKVASLIDFDRRAVMLNFPYTPAAPELRSLKRYQTRLLRHRKLRAVTLLQEGA